MNRQDMDSLSSVITQYQQPSGAYPASPNFAAYRYTWFRDGSFTADAMSRAGNIESAEQFFAWGAKVVTDRKDLILSGGTLDARYMYDGKSVDEEWGDFQLDGYGIFLWALKQHSVRHDRSLDEYNEAIELLRSYLTDHWQEPCYDWWEERVGVHATTLACIYAGLSAFDDPVAGQVKDAVDIDAERTDASLLVCGLFDAVDKDAFAPILQKIEAELVDNHGVHRYADDSYFGGGEWPVLSALLGWLYVKYGRTEDAKTQLAWCLAQQDENGWIPEQAVGHLLQPDAYEPWVERAGMPANPLLWSVAMTVTLASSLEGDIPLVL